MSVMVVDDHPALREVIKVACEQRPGLKVVAEASDGAEALQKVQEQEPAVMVVDLQLPKVDGFEVIRQLRARAPAVRILAMSDRDDPASVFEAVRLGADGYVEKKRSVLDIASAVEALAAGERVFTADHRRDALAELGLRARRSREAARTAAALTRREREVLSLVTEGLTNKQMARRLGVAVGTVESHLRGLYRKLGVRSRLQAVQVAAGLRLVPINRDDLRSGEG